MVWVGQGLGVRRTVAGLFCSAWSGPYKIVRVVTKRFYKFEIAASACSCISLLHGLYSASLLKVFAWDNVRNVYKQMRQSAELNFVNFLSNRAFKSKPPYFKLRNIATINRLKNLTSFHHKRRILATKHLHDRTISLMGQMDGDNDN